MDCRAAKRPVTFSDRLGLRVFYGLTMRPDISATDSNLQPKFKIEKILVPLDFSPASMEALDYAVSLAKQFRAAIHLVHVHPPDEPASVPGAAHLLLQSAKATERLNEELAGIHRKRIEPFCPENCHIRGGRPYQEILGLARELEADLIVLSTRGHPNPSQNRRLCIS
jgi:universal stress protein A